MTKEELDGNRIFVIHDFLTAEECAELIRRSEHLGYEPALIDEFVAPGVRNNDRVLVDDAALASDLFRRARPSLPVAMDDLALVGFNERFRFYRYGPGHRFKPHPDVAYNRLELCQVSHLTFMVYLNDPFEGGETRFFADMDNVTYGLPSRCVKPETGMALVFVHRIWHEAAEVRSGQKYVIRTDVMYGTPSPPPD